MNKTILSLLFAFVLSGTAVAKTFGGGNSANMTVESSSVVNHNSIPLPVASSANYFHNGVLVSTSGIPGGTGEDRSPALNFAASSFLSWTHNITALFASRIVEKSCLARAVYFEARSEPTLGQLAVATVILNRVKAPHYPSSICGVVYQGASHLNGCQFSFACDGKSDLPKAGRAWQKAIAVANLALTGEKEMEMEMENEDLQFVSTATHYHADYVEPYWSKSLSRLTKIGHHIFYSQV